MLAILEAVREGRANDPNDELWDYLIDRAYASEEWLDGQGVLERLAEVEASEVRYYPHHRRGTHLGRPRWQREIAEDILSCAGRGDFTGLYAVLDAVPKDVARNVLVGIRQKGIDVQYVPSRRASQRALRSRQFRDNRDEFVADLRSRLDDALWNTAMSEAQASIDQEDAADRTRRLTRERVQRHRQNRPE